MLLECPMPEDWGLTMKLEEYKKKRNFSKTTEPAELSESFCKGIVKKYKGFKLERPIYVIQEHHSSRLHWDLRLEFDGVLKSWALPKRPEAGEKRLAVQVEDHPLEYACFEGMIPENNYGAGSVIIWDKGTFETIEKKENSIVLCIKGKKLKGIYILYHFKPETNNWLFFKKKEK